MQKALATAALPFRPQWTLRIRWYPQVRGEKGLSETPWQCRKILQPINVCLRKRMASPKHGPGVHCLHAPNLKLLHGTRMAHHLRKWVIP